MKSILQYILQKYHSVKKAALPSAAIFCCSAVLAGCATVPVTGRRQVSLVSQSELVSQSSRIYRKILSGAELSNDPKKTRVLMAAGTRVARAAEEFMRQHGMKDEIRYYNWEFNLIKDDESINAFCLPGGKVGVYTGMYKVAPDAESLAVVLGHEAAHTIAHHGNERMSQQLLVQLGQATLAASLQESPERTQEIWTRVYGLGSQVGVLLPYSRRQEKEADRIGLIITAMAGYDPRAALDVWQRMKEQEKDYPMEFLSTHPAPGTRMEHIRQMLPAAMKYYEKSPYDGGHVYKIQTQGGE